MGYKELLDKQQKEAEDFSEGKIFFVFGSSKEEVTDKLYTEYGVRPSDIIGLGAGGYVLKEFYPDLNKLLLKHAEERKEYTLKNIYEVVQYYAWDYELYISLSYSLKTLCTDLMDLTEEEVQENKEEIQRAYFDYCKEFEKLNL